MARKLKENEKAERAYEAIMRELGYTNTYKDIYPRFAVVVNKRIGNKFITDFQVCFSYLLFGLLEDLDDSSKGTYDRVMVSDSTYYFWHILKKTKRLKNSGLQWTNHSDRIYFSLILENYPVIDPNEDKFDESFKNMFKSVLRFCHCKFCSQIPLPQIPFDNISFFFKEDNK